MRRLSLVPDDSAPDVNDAPGITEPHSGISSTQSLGLYCDSSDSGEASVDESLASAGKRRWHWCGDSSSPIPAPS